MTSFQNMSLILGCSMNIMLLKNDISARDWLGLRPKKRQRSPVGQLDTSFVNFVTNEKLIELEAQDMEEKIYKMSENIYKYYEMDPFECETWMTHTGIPVSATLQWAETCSISSRSNDLNMEPLGPESRYIYELSVTNDLNKATFTASIDATTYLPLIEHSDPSNYEKSIYTSQVLEEWSKSSLIDQPYRSVFLHSLNTNSSLQTNTFIPHIKNYVFGIKCFDINRWRISNPALREIKYNPLVYPPEFT